jgi:hypothetical protein
MDEFLTSLREVDPLWSVVLVAAAIAVLLTAKFASASFTRALAVAAGIAVIGGLASAGYYGFQHLEDTRRLEERRALDERAKLLFGQIVQADSVFACIDGSPVPAVLEACERSLFEEPRRVAAAVAVVTQRLVFLGDALAFAGKRDPDYFGRVEPLRKSMESDPYGFVAFALSVEHGCAADACARFAMFRSPDRVKENMRVRRLEAFLARYATAWKDGSALSQPAAAPAARTIAPLVTISGDDTARPAADATQSTAPAASASVPETAAPVTSVSVSEPPAAAIAPTITPPGEGEGFAGAQRPAVQVEGAPAIAPSASTAAAPAAAAKAAPKAATQAKAKAKAAAPADPVSRRSNEPVAGLPRVVPRDYIREKEEEEDPKAQASGQPPGAPMSISSPAQNFIGR